MTSLTTTINGLIDIDHLQAAKQPDVYFDRLSSQWLDLLNLVGVKDYQQINQIITALFELELDMTVVLASVVPEDVNVPKPTSKSVPSVQQ